MANIDCVRKRYYFYICIVKVTQGSEKDPRPMPNVVALNAKIGVQHFSHVKIVFNDKYFYLFCKLFLIYFEKKITFTLNFRI